MHDYLFNSEIVRFAFVFGICVSMMLYERFHLTTGSIVVPGYIAVFLVYPMVVVATFVNALLSYTIMNHFLRKHFMLYGKTKFTLMALISISIQTIMLKVSPVRPVVVGEQHPAVRRRRLRGAGADRPRHGPPRHQANDEGGARCRSRRFRTDRSRPAAATEGSQRPRSPCRLRHDVDRQSLDPLGRAALGSRVVGCRPALQPEVRRLRRRGVHRHVHG